MAKSLAIKTKWLDHLNSGWASEKNKMVTERSGANELYERLISVQEVVPLLNRVFHLRGLPLPDFDSEPLTGDEQEHYLDALLNSQLTLARTVCLDSPFSVILQKRLVILQRVFHAVSVKYHEPDRIRQHHQQQQQQQSEVVEILVSSDDAKKRGQDRFRSGADALIEMGVKTGLSLVFSLMRQNWLIVQQLSAQQGTKIGTNMCNDVLRTALDVVSNLPPLSLANESKLPALAASTLCEVAAFLKSVAMPNSGADAVGKRLSAELMLALATQRGSLRYILEWLDMALCASCNNKTDSSNEEEHRTRMISYNTFIDILQQMMKSAVRIFNCVFVELRFSLFHPFLILRVGSDGLQIKLVSAN